MSSRSRRQLEEWLLNLNVTGKILDVGGSQNPIWKRGICAEQNVTILDLYDPHEGSRKPDLGFDLNQVPNDNMIAYSEKGNAATLDSFDTVFCLEVMEYVYAPITALKTLASMMKKNATLYISFHWLYGMHNPEGEDCLRYTQYGIEKIMKSAGFRIEDMEVKTLSADGRMIISDFYREEGMRISRTDPNVFDEGYLVTAIKI